METAVNNYTGTVLYVSHDRYFINKTATRILDLTGQKLLSYNGNYSYYLDKKDTMEKIHLTPEHTDTQKKEDTESKLDWQEQKQLAAKRRKLENQYSQIEQKIEMLENEIAALDIELSLPEHATNSAKLTELSREREEKESALAEAMELWEDLAEQLTL